MCVFVARGAFLQILAYLVVLCFTGRCPKQNTVARFKPKHLAPPKFLAGYATGCVAVKLRRSQKLQSVQVFATPACSVFMCVRPTASLLTHPHIVARVRVFCMLPLLHVWVSFLVPLCAIHRKQCLSWPCGMFDRWLISNLL